MVTLGVIAVDIAQFMAPGTSQELLSLDVPLINAKGAAAMLRFHITTAEVGRADQEDGASVLTGISGLSDPRNSSVDQDLSGFETSGSVTSKGKDIPSVTIAESSPKAVHVPDMMSIKNELQVRAHKVTSLEKELEAATRKLEAAGLHSAHDHVGRDSSSDERVSSLMLEIRELKAELAEAAVIAEQKDRHEARANQAEAKLGELEKRLAGVISRPTSPSKTAAMDSELATYKDQIAKLMQLVEEHGDTGPISKDVEVLSARLQATEEELGQAEVWANEALEMAEAAKSENEQLRADLAQVRHDAEFAERKHAKERAGWELRIKDAFRRMEESIKLVDQANIERDEMAATAEKQMVASHGRIQALETETADLKAKLEPLKVNEKIAEEVDKAKKSAEAEASIEIDSLKKRIKEMEEYVEEADTARWEAETKASKAIKQAEEQSFGNPIMNDSSHGEAENQVESLSLEVKFLEAEKGRLSRELAVARSAVERAVGNAARDSEENGARIADLTAKLTDLRIQLQGALAAETEARSKISKSLHGTIGSEETGALMAKELLAVRGELAAVQADRDTAHTQIADLRRALSSQEAAVSELNDALGASQAQREEMERLHKALASAVSGGSRAGGNKGDGRTPLSFSESTRYQEQISKLEQQLQEAQSLAETSSSVAADVVQRLAEAQSGRQELSTRVGELREEVAALKTGADGDLRSRIQRLERDLTIARNRAEVNAMIKEEHDRVANDLIGTKLAWAVAQEEIVKLKRSLVKSQEKSMTFASKLTKLEAKFYKWREKRRSSSQSPEKPSSRRTTTE